MGNSTTVVAIYSLGYFCLLFIILLRLHLLFILFKRIFIDQSFL